jgi:hypothetical protein
VAGVDELQHSCRSRLAAEISFEENPEVLLRRLAAAGISVARQVDEVEA